VNIREHRTESSQTDAGNSSLLLRRLWRIG